MRRVPDLAVVSLAVTVQDKDAGRARDEANRRASAILERLRAQGLPDADVQAPSLTVHPTYDYSRGKPKITGYEASRPITLRIKDISLLGPILDGLVDDGATQVHGTAMELAEPEAASRGAGRGRRGGAGTGRGPGRSRRPGPGRADPDRGGRRGGPHLALPARRHDEMAADESAPTEIAAGEIEISASVRVWFALGLIEPDSASRT